jgi:uncharacterized protein
MKFHLTQPDGLNLITAHSDHAISVNHVQYPTSLIVSPHQLLSSWGISKLEQLTKDDFEHAIAIQPELILLGTGLKHQFIHPQLTKRLMDVNIGIECMTTIAACRTYNILMSEGRNVVAMLILENTL